MESSDYTSRSIESDRELAVVRKLQTVQPLPDSDKACAMADGWMCVFDQGDFKTGDLVIHIQPDAVLDPNHELTRKFEGKVICSKHIAGVRSQGIIFPRDVLKQFGADPLMYKETGDVTSIMKVRKFVPDEDKPSYFPENKDDALPFPKHLFPKTDLERMQNATSYFTCFLGMDITVTMKLDGQSTSFGKTDTTVHVASRNFEWRQPNPESQDLFDINEQHRIFETLPPNFALQGELAGPGICGNLLMLPEKTLFPYSLFNMAERQFCSWDDLMDMSTKLGLKVVPLVYRGKCTPEWADFEHVQQLVEGMRMENGVPVEGLVIRVEKTNQAFKILSQTYVEYKKKFLEDRKKKNEKKPKKQTEPALEQKSSLSLEEMGFTSEEQQLASQLASRGMSRERIAQIIHEKRTKASKLKKTNSVAASSDSSSSVAETSQ